MYLGLDLGTYSAKVALFDAGGDCLAESSAPYAVDTRQPGRAETDPADWWEAVVSCMEQIPGDLRATVRAIGLSGQMHGVVLVDVLGQALRPAILWMDQRAQAELAHFPADTLQRTGNPPSPGMAGAVLAWLRTHEPVVWNHARWALQPKDWLGLQLTGEAATEASDSSATLLADRHGHWEAALLAALGVPARLLAPVAPSTAVRGNLMASAAAALGLRAGIPVALGAGDTAAAAFGNGLYAGGDAQLTTGSGAQLIVMQTHPPRASHGLNSYCAAGSDTLPGWYAMAAMQNCGVALEWARGILGLSWPEAYARAFCDDARAEGAWFVPYLSGERSPWMAPTLRGGWHGLGTADDAGTLMHAAFLGVAFGIRAGLDALRASGLAIDTLRLAGGGSVHPAWQQMLIDALDLPLWRSNCANASARGAALLGAAALGMDSATLRALAPRLQPLGAPAQADRHQAAYQRFLRSVRQSERMARPC